MASLNASSSLASTRPRRARRRAGRPLRRRCADCFQLSYWKNLPTGYLGKLSWGGAAGQGGAAPGSCPPQPPPPWTRQWPRTGVGWACYPVCPRGAAGRRSGPGSLAWGVRGSPRAQELAEPWAPPHPDSESWLPTPQRRPGAGLPEARSEGSTRPSRTWRGRRSRSPEGPGHSCGSNTLPRCHGCCGGSRGSPACLEVPQGNESRT